MNTRHLRTMLAVLAMAAAGARAEPAGDVLLFTYFRDNGQHGVNLATSADGVHYTPLNGDRPVFTPPKWPGQDLVRDSSILYHDGMFHMVWTSAWKGRVFGYASSPDLKTWSAPRQVRPFPDALPPEDQPDNIWAPELHWDPVKGDFFILFASTTPRERNDSDASNNNGQVGSQSENLDACAGRELPFRGEDVSRHAVHRAEVGGGVDEVGDPAIFAARPQPPGPDGFPRLNAPGGGAAGRRRAAAGRRCRLRARQLRGRRSRDWTWC